MSIGRALTHLADRSPDAVAVRCGDTVLSRRDLDLRSNRLAHAWSDRVGHDDLVTVALPNGIDFVLACCAAWKLGATPQPLSPRLGAGERAAILQLVRPAMDRVAAPDGPGSSARRHRRRSTRTGGLLRSCLATRCRWSPVRCSTRRRSSTRCAG
jgi:acyl-CoA synthetase (AMP-forming)/AMP-acid ligase II